jgi:hypothetical protein
MTRSWFPRSLSAAARRTFFSLAAGLSLGALGCSSPTSTFGLAVTYDDHVGTKGSFCSPPGNAQGGSGARLDGKAEGKLPHLWVDTHQDGGNTPYEVVVARVMAYRPGTQVPAEREVLVARVYDEAFGTSQREDTFTATFEGRTFDFTLRGVSSSGGCAAVGPTSPRP